MDEPSFVPHGWESALPSLWFRAKEKLICCQTCMENVVESSTGASVCKGTIPTWRHNQAVTFPRHHLPRGTPWFSSRGNCQLPAGLS